MSTGSGVSIQQQTANMPLCGDMGGKKSNGEPCTRRCTPGHTRCYLHGAEAAASITTASMVLAKLRLPAIEALMSIIEQFNGHYCPSCGLPNGDEESKRTVIRACSEVLDRAQLGRHQTVGITPQSDGDIDLRQLTDEEKLKMMELLAELDAMKETIRGRTLVLGSLPIDTSKTVM